MTAVSNTFAATTSKAQIKSQLSGGPNALGKDDFLMLMVEQLKNQDPMNPQDATEFTAQLAQYSSLEQLFNVNDNLENMRQNGAEMQRMSALSMIGRQVVTRSSEFDFSGSPVQLGYKLDAGADNVEITIKDASGAVVATLPGTEMSAGQHFFAWDGHDGTGTLPSGRYTIDVVAHSGDNAVAATALISSSVVGVDLHSDGDMLVTNNGEFLVSEVESVRGN